MKHKKHLMWADVIVLGKNLRNRLPFPIDQTLNVYGVPRGGCHAMACVPNCEPVDCPEEADLILDDIIDSGKTMEHWTHMYPNTSFAALIDKTQGECSDKWVVFPWELRDEESGPEEHVRRILQFLGEDPKREGLLDTPKRFLKAMTEHTSGYKLDPADVLGVSFNLDDSSTGVRYDQIILSGPLPFNSMCEHHLAPFEGQAWIAYLPGTHGRVVGLSKLARVLDIFSRRLQVQERLTTQIADAIEKSLNPSGVGVLIKSRHLCQCHRGVRKEGRMVTSILRGAFREPEVRAEFLELVKLSNQ